MTVTLERLFPHLDELIQTPADLQRLNEAILQLAVQGKLVPQDPHDEPASELLKRIAMGRAQLVETGAIKQTDPLSPIEEDEIQNEIPQDWSWVRFGQLCYTYRGHNPPKHEFSYEPQEGYIRFIQITDFKTDDRAVYVPESPRNKVVYRGEILMAAYRHVGKVSRDVEGAFNVALCKVMEVPPMSRDYLEKLIASDYITKELLKASGRAHIPSMHTDHLLSLVVPLPPLAEQKRIVAKVDELFAQTRALEAKLRRAQEAIVVVNRAVLHHLHHAADRATFQHAAQILGDHFDLLYTDPRPVTDLRQTILQLAVQGKLVPQDPQDEPASELLEQIAVEKERLVAEGEIKRDELSPIEIEIFPLVPIQILCDVKGGIQKSRDRQPGQNPRRYLTVAHVQRNLIDTGDPRYFEVSDEELERWRLIKGDILIVEGNGSAEHIGRSAIFMGEIEDCVHQNHVIRVRPNLNFILPTYLNLYLNSPAGKEVMLERSRTTSGLFNLSVGRIKTIEVPLPSIQEQKRIVAKVDDLLARCAALESKLGQAQVAGRQLTAAVLHGAVG